MKIVFNITIHLLLLFSIIFAWNLSDYEIPSSWSEHTYTPSPDDWRKIAVYQIMTDRFYDGDPSINKAHSYSVEYNANASDYPTEGSRRTIGGDFKGLMEHLDYIKSLGFDAIWISCPMFGTEPNGYAPATYNALDPKLGTVAEFRELIDKIHEKNMYIIVDCVANHFANWFFDNTGGLQWSVSGREYGSTFGDAIGMNDFHDAHNISDWNDQYQLEHYELVGLDDLKTENDYVKNYVATKWANFIKAFDIDGFRVDAIKHVNVAEWSYFCGTWRQAATEIGKNNFYMFGEAYSGSHAAVGYYTGYKAGQPNRLMNGMMDYAMYMAGVPWKLFGDQWSLKSWIEGMNNSDYDMGQGDGTTTWNGGNLNLHFVDNHDQARFLGDGGDAKKMLAVMGMITLIEGVGGMYYGSEQAFNTGGKDGKGAYSAMFDHPFQYDNAVGDKFDMTFWLYKDIARMMSARRQIKDDLGSYTNIMEPQNDIFAFKRNEAFIAINGSASVKTASYNLGSGQYVNLLDGSVVDGSAANISLDAYEVSIWKKDGDPILEPIVTSVIPAHASSYSDPTITITFDQDMDPTTTTAAASVTPDVGGSWSVQGNKLILSNANISIGTEYTIRVANTAKAAAANGKTMFGGFMSRFTGGMTEVSINGTTITFTIDKPGELHWAVGTTDNWEKPPQEYWKSGDNTSEWDDAVDRPFTDIGGGYYQTSVGPFNGTTVDIVNYVYKYSDGSWGTNQSVDVPKHTDNDTSLSSLEGDIAEPAGVVDGLDLIKLAISFGSISTDSGYDIMADLNRDNSVDGLDLIILAINFGTEE